jgi:hypothetical protein
MVCRLRSKETREESMYKEEDKSISQTLAVKAAIQTSGMRLDSKRGALN